MMPAAPAASDSIKLSMINCRATCARPAPIASRVASSLARRFDLASATLARFTRPDQQDERGASPEEIERGSNAANEDLLEQFDLRVEACVDQELFELRKSLLVRGIDRVDLLLSLLHRRAGFQPADVVPAVAVPEVVRLL